MTGEDHDQDALIAVLTSPALEREHVGEDAAVAAMLGAMSADPVRPAGHRSRRGIAIAAVTVASLGVGGLVAAGPGVFFFPAADRSPATDPSTTEVSSVPTTSDVTHEQRTEPSSTLAPAAVVLGDAAPSDDEDAGTSQDTDGCDGNHGDAVSDVARSTDPGEQVSDIARSDCGKPGTDDRESPSNTAPGQTGDNPSNTAPGQTGDSPSDTAPGRTGDTNATTAPGQTGDNGRP